MSPKKYASSEKSRLFFLLKTALIAILICIAFTTVATIVYRAPQIHLFILSGQSNMHFLDPKLSFIPTLKHAFPENEIIIVKDASTSVSISKWYEAWVSTKGKKAKGTNDLYKSLMKKVLSAIDQKDLTTVTFIWMQGERDAKIREGRVYAKSLAGLLKQLSHDLNRADINMVIGRLSDYEGEKNRCPHWSIVRNAQMEFSNSNSKVDWINTDDLNGPDDKLHYTKKGYVILGERFAKKAIEIIEKN